MAKALKIQQQSEMVDFFKEGEQTIRMGYYPPCPQPDQVIGLDPHSDAGGLTILLQVNEMQGLQIKKDGLWVPINPLPDAFVVNIGDQLEIMTNGIYRSIEHRATVNSKKERISIAAFHDIEMGGYLTPACSLVTPENPALYKTITSKEYVEGLLGSKIKGKSYLDVVKIKNEIRE
ncbi:hypothetical protein TSUD_242680 [Trifolium subterraneum]|uniref:Fe2OG dioxygenase domain-containing protein n=1 Tax=Trifolium subterraneum TaxID=3900 RepID=A0A2Z6LSG6_TRISU|nr:hypothetical protein TSUD_242680 [Trifolium subterraneum]